MHNYTLSHLTAIDGVGRILPEISGYKSDRKVGLFYFLWHGLHNPGSTVRNATELLKTNYEDLFDRDPQNSLVPKDAWLHVSEPLYGYYHSMDEWVMRKHIELFIAAGLDFVTFDFTNGFYYDKPLENFLKILRSYKDAGWKVPQVSFYLWIKGNELAHRLLDEVYTNEAYKDLVFCTGSGKPLLIGSIEMDACNFGELLDQEILDYFDVRQSDVCFGRDSDVLWPYWQFKRDWKVYTDMVNVSSAQAGNAFSFAYEPAEPPYSNEVHGRGWSSSHPSNGDAAAILRGENAQEGWDNAIAKDPEMIFVCGWNEWVVQKCFLPDGMPHYTDNFSVEFSRDIEMLKNATFVEGEDGTYVQEGFGDNFYMQLAYNIRKFKGLAGQDAIAAPTAIDIYGDLAQWDAVKGKYLALSTEKEARQAPGFYDGLVYTQAAPENVIESAQVAHDGQNVYFKITAKKNIETDVRVLIGVEDSAQTNWCGFNYVVKGKELSNFASEVVGAVSRDVRENVLQIAVPRDLLGISKDGFKLTFKVTMGVDKEGDILDYYVSGEVFPVGRYAYSYRG
ncbi:MAG: hypothetical protein IKU26_00600 [Clostridia bacterium]|nr:hypothetical protein [Clostridia bacterium]